MSIDPKKFGITSSLVETVKEALKGNQHKIDVAPPHGKITGADFKKLRGETSDPVTQSNINKVNAVAADLKKMASEPIKPMGSKTSSTTSLPKATFNLKPPMGEAAKPDFLDLDKDGNKKEPMKQAAKQTKEEVEQVDELSKSTLGSYIKKASGRVADRSRHAGDIENRRDISPAAKEVLAKHNRKVDNSLKGISRASDRLAKEEVEQVDETSDEKRAKYKKNAERSVAAAVMKTGLRRMVGMKSPSDKDSDTIRKRVQGLTRQARASKSPEDASDAAAMRYKLGVSEPRRGKGKLTLKKEEADQFDEVLDTANKKMKYIEKAGKQIMDYEPYKDRDGKGADRVRKRTAGALMLKRKIAKKGVGPVVDEEVEMTEAESHAAKQIAARKEAMKTHIQKKIANKQMSAMQAKANQRLKSINASNDKCSCGDTNESKMKCEMHGGKDKDAKMGREKIEVNPPLREAEDLPKKVITKGHEIAKTLIKSKAKVREPYAVGMAAAKKSAGIKG